MYRLVAVLFCFIAFNSYSCQLDVRLEQYAPESQKNKSNNWFGVDIELTQALLTEAQCRYSILEISWARALVMLAHGELDMMLNVSKTSEREKSYYFIGPIRNEVIVFATYKNSNYVLTSIDDIIKLDKPIAIQRNAYYGEAIEYLLQHEKHHKMFINVTDNETKLKLLKRGRISGFLEARRNIIHGVKSDNNFKGVWFSNLEIHNNPVYFALSKKSINLELKQKISQSFEHLVTEGKIEQIVLKHQFSTVKTH